MACDSLAATKGKVEFRHFPQFFWHRILRHLETIELGTDRLDLMGFLVSLFLSHGESARLFFYGNVFLVSYLLGANAQDRGFDIRLEVIDFLGCSRLVCFTSSNGMPNLLIFL